jgi:L-fuconolactonase
MEVDPADGLNLREAEFVAEMAEREPRLLAMVATVPLEDGPEAVADQLAILKPMKLMRGVRRLIERHPDEPGWAVRKPFVEGVQALAGFGFSFDICVKHHQLEDAIALVDRCPEIRFVLDHIGKPAIRDGLTRPWRDNMKTLAGFANVWCKISGAVTEADHAHWREQDIIPYVEHAIDCFGYERAMFGGDWPVMEQASTYRRWVDLVDRVVSGASDAERRRLYRDNAIAFYRLDTGD